MAIMENKRIYDFQVYAPSVLGNSFRHVECLGNFPYETAIILAGELSPIHAEVYSTGQLPAGTPNDPRQYDYYRFKKPDGSIVTLGEPWIVHASIAEVVVSTAIVTIPNVSTSDLIQLQTMLKQAGFIDYEIKFGT